ncbi:hypothetical protein B5G03_12980 [Gemmiger sp. An50]|nr:hypothetical protein B5G03_12980 [Gemmiger sp. An50]
MLYMTGRLQKKNDYYYVVLQLRDTDGNRKQKWIATGLPVKGNKARATEEMRKILNEYERANLLFSPNEPFVDVLEQWLEHAKLHLEINTYSNYEIIFRAHLQPYFLEHPIELRKIQTAHIQAYCNYKLQTLSPVTVKKHLSNISCALEEARKNHIIPYNPAHDVILRGSKKFIPNFYDEKQIAQLFQAARKSKIETEIILACTYGLRRSEVAGLTWSQVDFEKETILISKTAVISKGGTVYKERTKTKKSCRVLPMSSEIKQYLQNLYNRQQQQQQSLGAHYHPSDFVCRQADGRVFSVEAISSNFKKLLADNDLPPIRFHDLRHSAATKLLADGYNMKCVSEFLGHCDIHTTMNIYAHVSNQTKKEMAGSMGGLLNSLNDPPPQTPVEAPVEKIIYFPASRAI